MRNARMRLGWRRGARLIGVVLGVILVVALSAGLSAGVAFGHRYDPRHRHVPLWSPSLLSPATLAATPPNCSTCANTSSGACYNGCSYGGITYYYRQGFWFAYDGANWYCYYDGCWQLW